MQGTGAALVGAAIGQYSGLALLIPLGAAAAFWAITSKTATGTTKVVHPAVAVQVGHVVWFFVAAFSSPAALSSIWFDILLMTGGLIWLYLKPGLGPIVLLTAWQALALLINVQALVEASIGTAAHKALLVHVALRITAIYLMVTTIAVLRRESRGEPRAAD